MIRLISTLSIIVFICIEINWANDKYFVFTNNWIEDTTLIDTIKTWEFDALTIVGDRAKSIPGSGQYISSRQLSVLNQPNINQILRSIPGINVRDEEGFGLRPNIGLRGTPVNRCAKITLMEDGMLIAPAPYSDPSAYYFPTFARMQGIEVLKGSSQIKYGPYTIGGAINLISTPIPESFKAFAQFSYGSFGTQQQRIWVGDSHKNIDYIFEVNRLASNGFKELDKGGNTGFDRRDVLAKLRWHTDDKASIPQSVTLKFVHSTEAGNESYLGLTLEDFKANPYRRYAATQKDILDMSHYHVSINHTIKPISGFSVITTAYYAHTFRDWARVNTIGGQSINNILGKPVQYSLPYEIMTGEADGYLDYQNAARTYFSEGIQSNAQYIFNTNQISHKVMLGGRYHRDQADRYATKSEYSMTAGNMSLVTSGTKGNQENQIRNGSSWAFFINYDIHFKNLKVSPGLRYENIAFDFQNYGTSDNTRTGLQLKSATNQLDVVLPGVGINYTLNKSMSIFGGVHKGFSPPGMPSVGSNTVQAQPETAINYEMGYRINRENLQFQAVGFLNVYDNILGSDNVSGGGAGTGDMFNAGKAKIQGLEASIDYDLWHSKREKSPIKVPVNISYTLTNARFLETFINAGGDWGSGQINRNDKLPFITPHLLSSSIGFENIKGNITLTGRYIGTTRTKSGQGKMIIPEDNVGNNTVNALGNFLIIDLSSNVRINKYFSVFSTINNLTNNKSIVSNLPNGYRPGMPFSFNFGMKVVI